MNGKTVVVGMSGGVDSSVSAYLLKQQGYNVIGLFMKNWESDDTDEYCSAEQDYNDVKRVCEVIGIPYYSINFSKQYMDNVFAQFLDGLGKGYTPNPDILCNREIKFGPFLEYAKKIGADYIATGHYCRVKKVKTDNKKTETHLLKGIDPVKDQSYFLCGLGQEQLDRVIFPIGHLQKSQVRKIAQEQNLVTAQKKDSTGICFIGERKIRDFLKSYFGNQTGEIKTLDNKIIGKHNGLMYYTIGQRKGLGIGGLAGFDENKWFVVRKCLKSNTLFVNNGECDELFTDNLVATNFNWIGTPEWKSPEFECYAKTRYRQPDQKCRVYSKSSNKVYPENINVEFTMPQRAITPGQWVVLYDEDRCLGGGIIVDKNNNKGG